MNDTPDITDNDKTAVTVFICYAHEDNSPPARWFSLIQKHLAQLEKSRDILILSDKDISPGELWGERIRDQLESSTMAILMVSPAFLNSEYVRNDELPVLLAKALSENSLKIVPVIIRAVALEVANFSYPDPVKGPNRLNIGELQMLNSPDEPLSVQSARELDESMVKLVRLVYREVESSRSERDENNENVDCEASGEHFEEPGDRTHRINIGKAAFTALLSVGLAIVMYMNWQGEWYMAFWIAMVMLLLTFFDFILEISGQNVSNRSVQMDLERVEHLDAPFRIDVMAGVYGGILAGFLGGIISGVSYQISSGYEDIFAGLFPRIVVAGALMGLVLGLLCRTFVVYFMFLSRRLGKNGFLFNEFTGGLIGGMLMGAIMGPLLGWSFGPLPYSLIDAPSLFAGVLISSVVFTLVVRVYDLGYLSPWVVRNFLVSLLISAVIVGLCLVLDDALGYSYKVAGYFYDQTNIADPMTGGFLLGLPAGAVVGVIVGTNLLLQRIWRTYA